MDTILLALALAQAKRRLRLEREELLWDAMRPVKQP